MEAFEIIPPTPEAKKPNNNLFGFKDVDGKVLIVNLPDDKRDLIKAYCNQNDSYVTLEQVEIFLHTIGCKPNKKR